jgi:transmembrane sensor
MLFKGRNKDPENTVMDELWNELELYPAELDPSLSDLMEQPVGKLKRPYRVSGLATAASLLVAVGAWLWLASADPGLKYYQTERGERVVLNLADGSIIQLNSASRLAVLLDEGERRIEIERGEALFDVAKDPDRKFVVHTPHGKVEAIGTLFNVNLHQQELVVTIAEGKVLVSNEQALPSKQAAETAIAGQQIIVGRDGVIRSAKLDDLQAVLAWTEGKIMFTGESLQAAIEQVNRYSKHRIAILDARLTELPIYGVFNVGDSRGFLSALEKSYSIEAIEESGDLSYLAYRAAEQ